MATNAQKPVSESNARVPDRTRDLIQDVTGEVKHEVHRIQTFKEPVDPTQSDHVVRRHAAGLSIWFFVAIALFLAVATAVIMISSHMHH
jgi:hypothetical protein